MPRRRVTLPRYYTEVFYEEEHYEDGDGVLITEHHPYHAIREAPEEGVNGSHEIGRTHTEHWAKLIVSALNAESRRKSRRRARAAAEPDGD